MELDGGARENRKQTRLRELRGMYINDLATAVVVFDVFCKYVLFYDDPLFQMLVSLLFTASVVAVACATYAFFESLHPRVTQKLTTQEHLLVVVPGLFSSEHNYGAFVDGLSNSNTYVLVSSANCGLKYMTRPLYHQATRLLNEISYFLADNDRIVTDADVIYRFKSISFIGSSLGGMVVREAFGSERLKSYAPRVQALKRHAYISLNSPHHGVPTRKNWFNDQIAIALDARYLYDNLTTTLDYPPLYDIGFDIVALISVEHDTSVTTHSSQAAGAASLHPIYRHVIKSEYWIDWIFGRYAHSLACHRPQVVYNLRRLLEAKTSKDFVWED